MYSRFNVEESLKTVAILTITIPCQHGNISAQIIRPILHNDTAEPLIACHGISRSANLITELFSDHATTTGRMIIVPHFDKFNWPVFQRITKKHRPDIGLLALIDALKQSGVIKTNKVHLFGYSGGAQLAHRFALLYPHLIKTLHIGSSGWFTFPDKDIPYPIGLGKQKNGNDVWGPKMTAGLSQLLKRPIHIYVGENDTSTTDPALRKNAILDATQGATRVIRASNYVDVMRKSAKRISISPQLYLHMLPGCTHDFAECFTGGLGKLLMASISKNTDQHFIRKEQ